MRFLIVETYYPEFLAGVYSTVPGLKDASYVHQMGTLMSRWFGQGDSYPHYLRALGHDAEIVIANCEPVQRQWAKENRFRLPTTWTIGRRFGVPAPCRRDFWNPEIVIEQIRALRPDVIHIKNPVWTPRVVLDVAHETKAKVTTQIASPYPPEFAFSGYDLVFSSLPNFVSEFKRRGLPAAYMPLGFDPRVLKCLSHAQMFSLVFVGGLSEAHSSRTRFLDALSRRIEFAWWGYGAECLPEDSPARGFFKGLAWGLDMFQILHNARISLNFHIDVACDYANNLRLFEATGVGSLLLTEWKQNLGDLFEIEREIVAYRHVDECAERARYYLDREAARKLISEAGQIRTVRDYSYANVMRSYVEAVS